MSKTSIYTVRVEFGDCDPAGIVFFPNLSRWMDSASHHFFRHCGLPPWRDLTEPPGVVGAPLLEIHTRFLKSVTYGELIFEGRETRALCVRNADGRIKPVPVPEFVRSRCG